jgi:hypothetical protein
VTYTGHLGGTFGDSWNAISVNEDYFYGSLQVTDNNDPVYVSFDGYTVDRRPIILSESFIIQV